MAILATRKGGISNEIHPTLPFSLKKKSNTKKLKNPKYLKSSNHDAGRDCGQEEKGSTEDEMAGWHHGLDGCESE